MKALGTPARCHTQPAHAREVVQSAGRSFSPIHPPKPAIASTSAGDRREASVAPAARVAQFAAASAQASESYTGLKQKEEAPEGVTQPAGQRQLVEPAPALYRPAGQGAQVEALVAPVAVEKVPAGQGVGAAEPCGQKKPAGHTACGASQMYEYGISPHGASLSPPPTITQFSPDT